MNEVVNFINSKKAVIFDLFHTLTALESTWGNNVPMTSQILGVTKEEWNSQLLEKSRDRLTGIDKDPYHILKKMAHAINPSIPEELIRKVMAIRIERFAGAMIHIPANTIRTLKALKKKGKKLGLISNADVTEVAAWPESPIQGLFDSTILSCYVGMVKPDAEIYELSLKQLGLKAADCVFVGDGGSNELEGAQKAGLSTIMITGIIREIWPERIEGRKKNANYIIETIDELVNETK
jgi:putative hydrolase of the HAD superfamily